MATSGEISMQKIFIAGISYKIAPVAMREQFAVAPSEQELRIKSLISEHNLHEAVVLWTCNRVEIYGAADTTPDPRALMATLAGQRLHPGTSIYFHTGRDAVHHLLSVASGMDSMVLGETEITGQVKASYEKARINGATGKHLNRLFQKSLETAKLIRSETAIGRGAASVGSVAVQHAQRVFGAGLHGRSIMVIGAGNMAEKCLKHLQKRGVSSVAIVNRSLDKAESLAMEYGGVAVPFGQCFEAMANVDIVIASTGSPHIILERRDIEHVMQHRADRPLVMIDIAVPRDISPDVRHIPGVHLHDIGDLQETVNETIRYREQDLALCWTIIGEQTGELAARMERAEAMTAAREFQEYQT